MVMQVPEGVTGAAPEGLPDLPGQPEGAPGTTLEATPGSEPVRAPAREGLRRVEQTLDPVEYWEYWKRFTDYNVKQKEALAQQRQRMAEEFERVKTDNLQLSEETDRLHKEFVQLRRQASSPGGNATPRAGGDPEILAEKSGPLREEVGAYRDRLGHLRLMYRSLYQQTRGLQESMLAEEQRKHEYGLKTKALKEQNQELVKRAAEEGGSVTEARRLQDEMVSEIKALKDERNNLQLAILACRKGRPSKPDMEDVVTLPSGDGLDFLP